MVHVRSDTELGAEVPEDALDVADERARARILRIPVSGLHTGSYELDAEASHYALRVHRVTVSDVLELFDPRRGELARVSLSALPKGKRASLSVEIDAVLRVEEPSLPITLLVCVAKGDKPEQALRDATALGVERVVLVLSSRVQSPSGTREFERYEKVMIETARQSGRGTLPELAGPVSFERALSEAPGLKLACVPGESSVPLLAALRAHKSERPSVLIGPEGGLSSSEVARLREEHFVLCSLGPFVLRAELAVPVALGLVQGHLWAERAGSSF